MDRFTRVERITLAVAVVVAAAAGVFAWTNFTRAFPEAHLSFAVNRASSEPVAEAFLREHAPLGRRGAPGSPARGDLQVDDAAKVYLERELGLARLEALDARPSGAAVEVVAPLVPAARQGGGQGRGDPRGRGGRVRAPDPRRGPGRRA